MKLSQYLQLVDVQAKMILKSDASRFYLGYIWWLLEPLLFVAVFYVVFDVLLDSGRTDFLVFLMCGKLPFVWFSKSVTQASNSIVGNAGLIGKIDIPKTLFPMAVIQEGLYRQSIVFFLLFAVVLIWGYQASLVWLWIIPIILVQYLMIVACSFVAATLVCYLRDFSMLIPLGMAFLMFTSGIFWDVRTLPDPEMAAIVLAYNPLAFLLDAYRQVLMTGVQPDVYHLAVLAVGFASVALLVARFMGRTSKRLALRALTS
jgi:lipopolysaccharide transport system permease protein